MAFWCKRKSTEAPLRPWNLPGDVGTVSLPDLLSVELEDEQTLVARSADGSISFRFSSISFCKKGDSSEDIAKAFIRRRADENRHAYYEVGTNGITYCEERSEQDGKPLIIRYWHVGAKNTVVIASATTESVKPADPSVQRLLALTPRIIESITLSTLHTFAYYDGEQVPITEKRLEPGGQNVVPLTPQDETCLSDNRQLAAAFGIKYGTGGALTADELDVIFARWMFDDETKESAESVAMALGIAFGDYFVEEHGFRWVVINDEHGTEYAIRHSTRDLTAFPRSSVSKRIEDNEPQCFKNLRVVILDLKRRMQED